MRTEAVGGAEHLEKQRPTLGRRRQFAALESLQLRDEHLRKPDEWQQSFSVVGERLLSARLVQEPVGQRLHNAQLIADDKFRQTDDICDGVNVHTEPDLGLDCRLEVPGDGALALAGQRVQAQCLRPRIARIPRQCVVHARTAAVICHVSRA